MTTTAARCTTHPAYEADYCPACGTTTPITERTTVADLHVGDLVDCNAGTVRVTAEPTRTHHSVDGGGQTWAAQAIVTESTVMAAGTPWTLQGNDHRRMTLAR